MSSSLDFIVIGAQKAGTTTLYRHLVDHPSLHLPPEKEAPFFSRDDRYARGMEWYLHEFFRGASVDALWGTVSPEYMTRSCVPARLAATVPQVRLIALLRDPIERAISHYMMSVRRGIERRSVDEALTDSLARRSDVIDSDDEAETYVPWGEYGRILGRYSDYFPRDQILVTFTDDLAEAPERLMAHIYMYLGVRPHRPSQLGERFHVGGARARLPWVPRLRAIPGVRAAWHLLPWRLRRQWMYWFQQWNTVRGGRPSIHLSTREALEAHFRRDAVDLRSVTQARPSWPWLETRAPGIVPPADLPR